MINIKSFAKQKDSYIVAQGNSTIKTSSTIAGSDIDKYFYMDDVGNLHTPYVFIGDKQVAALGIGNTTGGTGGSIEIIDNLDSTSTNAALSANQGRVLKALIDSLDGGSGTGTAFENASILAAITQTNIDNWNTAFTNNHTHSNKSVLDNLTQSVIDNSHTHSNKTILDAITSDDITNWGTAYTNNHTHSNKTVLDGITSTKVTNWNTAYTNNHTHSNKTVLDNLTQTVIDNSHTHVNKTVLDGITSTNIENWDKITDYFYLDSDNNLHTGYNLIGDKSVSAYGLGSTSSGGNLSVVDNLTSTSTTSALSANQGRVLKGLIDSIEATGSVFENATVLAGITSDNVTHWNTAYTNNHTHSNKTVIDGITSTKVSNWDTAYGWGDHSAAGYVKSSGVTSITIKNGTGITGGSNTATTTTGTYTIGLTTAIQTDIANGATAYGWGNHASAGYLTSHQDISGKENTSNKVSSWSTTTNNTRYPSEKLVKDSLDGKISTTHAANNVTSTKISNWDTAYTNNHTHSNKSTLDGITSTKVTNWDNVAGYFYLDSDGNLHTSYNLIGDKSVSAYGAGSSSSGGTLSVVDNLTSTSTSSALSANQGRVLKGLIDTLSSQGSVFDNATVLAGITSTKVSNWDSAATNSHTHSNKTVIDGITSTKVSNWDTAYGWGNHASAGYLKSVSWSQVSSKPTFATVATSGKYSDLTGTPTIPTTLPASDVSAWAKAATKPSYAWSEITDKPALFKSHAEAVDFNMLDGTTDKSGWYYLHSSWTQSNKPSTYGLAVCFNVDAGHLQLAYSQGDGRLYYRGMWWSGGGGKWGDWNKMAYVSDIPTTLPASDVYSWAKAASKPSYGWTEITGKPTSMPASDVYSWAKAASKPSYSWSEITSKPSFATVATSGKYSDLSGTPTSLPANGGTADKAGIATYVLDYGNDSSTIRIGYAGSSLTTATYLAAYGEVNGQRVIKDISPSNITAGKATSLATSRNLWGQSFNGTAAVKGTITSDYFLINDNSSNPYLKLVEGSNTWYCQVYTNHIALGSTYSKSLKVDSSGTITISNGTKSVDLSVDSNGCLKVSGNMYATGAVSAYADESSSTPTTRTIQATDTVNIDTTKSGGGVINVGHSGLGMTTYLLGYSVNIGKADSRPYGTAIYASYSLSLNSQNNLSIGGVNVSVSASSNLTCNKSWTVSSDIRLKNVYEDVKLTFDDIKEFPLFEYSLKNDENDNRLIGSSAQYWEDKLSTVVNEDSEGYKSLDYTAVNLSINKALVEKIKEQDEYIETLENRIKMLEEKFAKFEAILS